MISIGTIKRSLTPALLICFRRSMITTGNIIEYLDNGKFICGFVIESQPKRVRLINQNGREVNLPISRVVHSSQKSFQDLTTQKSRVELLQSVDTKRSQLMGEIDLEMIWELASEENNSHFKPNFLAELSTGSTADDDSVAAFLRCVFLDRVFFKYKEGKILVFSPEKVEQLKHQQEMEEKKRELIANGAQALQDLVNGRKSGETIREECGECLEIVGNYYLFGNEAQHSDITRQILKTAGLNRPHDPYHIMVKAGLWDKNENIPLLKNDLPVNFSLDAIRQAESILQVGNHSLSDDPARVDMRHLSLMTIDGATTLDYDDALSVEQIGENYLVGVHISDVAHYVKPNDPLFKEALQRCSSLYFPECQVPMLPRHLSQGICSLRENEVRAAMSFMILLDNEAEVLKVRIQRSIIQVARRLSYEGVDGMIDSDPELQTLANLARKLRKKRLEHGALLLPFPDVNIFIDSQERVQVHLGDVETPSRILVSEMMILANTQTAKYLSDRMVPGLFRSQGPPKKRIVHGEDSDLFQNTLQRKCLSKGELLTTAKQHCGLGVNHYTTVTSPIRRLLDLIIQHQLHSVLNREEPIFSEDQCKDFGSLISRTTNTINNVKQQRHRYWLLKYLESRKSELFDALVIDRGPKRTNLLLSKILFDFDLPSTGNNQVSPGSNVKVRISRVNALDNMIRFELA